MTGAILNPKIEKYLDDLLPKRDSLLAEMEKLARRRDIPIIGPACGRLALSPRENLRRQARLRNGLSHRLLHHLVGPRHGPARPGLLHRRRRIQRPPRPRIFRSAPASSAASPCW